MHRNVDASLLSMCSLVVEACEYDYLLSRSLPLLESLALNRWICIKGGELDQRVDLKRVRR